MSDLKKKLQMGFDAPAPIRKEEFLEHLNISENANKSNLEGFLFSQIDDSTFSFYRATEVPRKVTSHPYATRIGFRAILSARYYLTNTMHSIEHIGHIEDMEDLKGYSQVGTKNGFNIYENENYIPMGFSFDSYITEEEYAAIDATAQSKDRILPKYLIVSDADSEQVSKVIPHAELVAYNMPSIKQFGEICAERRATACTDFAASDRGFTATANLETDNYVFFSVPYEEGFTAYVDGAETEIVRAQFGFMAVRVPAGIHAIEFKYIPSGLKRGMWLSLAGLVLLIIILIKNCLTLKHDYGKLS